MNKQTTDKTARNRDDYERQRLEACVDAMENCCDEARRAIADTVYPTTQEKAMKIVHVFAWGWANASVNLDAAIAAVERRRKREEEEKKETVQNEC